MANRRPVMANRRPVRPRQTTKPKKVDYPVEEFMADKKTDEPEVVEETTVEPEEDIDLKTAVIRNGKKLNLRTGKSKTSSVLAVLDPNTKLTVLNYDPEAEWTQVTAVNDDAFGDTAYVMTEFIEVK